MHHSQHGFDGEFNNVRKSAAWLGLPVTLFRKEAEEHADLLPAQKIGDAFYYHWMDLLNYARWRQRQQPAKVEKKAPKNTS